MQPTITEILNEEIDSWRGKETVQIWVDLLI